MANLWTWAAQEIKAPYEAVRDLWVRDENGWPYSSLAMAMRALDAKWAEAPILTAGHDDGTSRCREHGQVFQSIERVHGKSAGAGHWVDWALCMPRRVE